MDVWFKPIRQWGLSVNDGLGIAPVNENFRERSEHSEDWGLELTRKTKVVLMFEYSKTVKH